MRASVEPFVSHMHHHHHPHLPSYHDEGVWFYQMRDEYLVVTMIHSDNLVYFRTSI